MKKNKGEKKGKKSRLSILISGYAAGGVLSDGQEHQLRSVTLRKS